MSSSPCVWHTAYFTLTPTPAPNLRAYQHFLLVFATCPSELACLNTVVETRYVAPPPIAAPGHEGAAVALETLEPGRAVAVVVAVAVTGLAPV